MMSADEIDSIVDDMVEDLEADCKTDRERELVQVIRDMRRSHHRFVWAMRLIGTLHLVSALVCLAACAVMAIRHW